MKLKDMKKEDLELLSYTKIAKMILEENKTTMTTAALFKEICNLLHLSEKEYQDKITDFFQSLTTSKEFILLQDGKWDLKSNHSIKIDIDEIYEEKDEEEENEEDNEEELEEDINADFDNMSDDDYEDNDLGDLSIVTEDELDSE